MAKKTLVLEQLHEQRESLLQPSKVPYPSLQIQRLKSFFPNGLQRGLITEVSGPRSAGRMSIGLQILAAATCAGEVCAIVDSTNNFSPESAAAAGVCLPKLLWVRCCGQLQWSLHVADLLLHAGGFGVVWLDLCELPARALNRIRISYWYRFKKTLESTPCNLLISSDQPQVAASSINKVDLKDPKLMYARGSRLRHWSGVRLYGAVKEPPGLTQEDWLHCEV